MAASASSPPAALLTVGVAQTASQRFDFDATLGEFRARCREAKALGVQLLVFPEAFFGGYPKFLGFGAVVGTRSDEGRREFAQYARSAVAVPSAQVDAMVAVLRDEGLPAVAVGVVERDGSTLYCSLLYLDAERGLVGKHRKLMPTASERLIWGNGDGSEANLKVHELQLGVGGANGPTAVAVGGAICWENMMPLLRYALYRQGLQLYVAPTVDARPSWLHSMAHIAVESRSFVLSANQFATAKDFPDWHRRALRAQRGQPEDAAAADDDEVLIGGGSCIVSPMGEVLAGPLRDRTGVLTAEIDLDQIVGARFDMDPVGHYARSDVFDLRVNGRQA
jgi:predicted amidohydrolase